MSRLDEVVDLNGSTMSIPRDDKMDVNTFVQLRLPLMLDRI
jgi:hypothetical protein